MSSSIADFEFKGVVFGFVLAVLIAGFVPSFWAGTFKASSQTAPTVPAPAGVANPTWQAWATWAVAEGASVDNFTFYWTAFGPERIVRPIADGTFVSNDFIFFDAGTIATADMPVFTDQDFFCRHLADSKVGYPLSSFFSEPQGRRSSPASSALTSPSSSALTGR